MYKNKWLIVIPARLASTRLPNKPLQDLGGKPLIVRVYENLAPLKQAGMTIVVACDSQEVLETCRKYDVYAEMTRVEHQSGTDRIYEIAQKHKYEYILNVQGDEPFILIKDLEKVTSSLENHPAADLATLAIANEHMEDYKNPNVVKVVLDSANFALYFSRSPIPYFRDQAQGFLQHMGVYAYRLNSLSKFCGMAPSSLENAERLEQLRALQAGMKIYVELASSPSLGIDTPEDLKLANERFAKR